jgi:molybdopterin-containing oxidoreductase family iron-sulfur binding subunit
MARWGMVIDLDRCTGCQACVVACKAENNVPVVTPREAQAGRLMLWMTVIPEVEGEFPRVRARFTPRPCMQCENPPCVKVCPVQAMTKSPEGIVSHVFARCIGCRFCVQACPYGVTYFNWQAPSWPADLREALNPDFAIRPTGVVEMCDFCHHRLQHAREEARADGREVRGEGEYVPACVQACPARALIFGDLDDPNTAASRLAHSPRAFRMLEDLGTAPKVYYLKEG